MSLSATVSKAVGAAFNAAGDLVVSGVLRRNRPAAYSATTGAPLSVYEEWRDVECVVGTYGARQVDESRIFETDRRIFIKARDNLPEPRPGDDVEIAHQVFHILQVGAIKAGAAAVLYDCQGRL